MPSERVDPLFDCVWCGRRLVVEGDGNVTTLVRCRCGHITLVKVVPRAE